MLTAPLAACDTLDSVADAVFGDPPKEHITGTRISVLALDHRLEADPALANTEVRLPGPHTNTDWPQSGGFPNHSMQHLTLPATIAPAWRVNIGAGASRYGRILSQPVVAAGRVYALDAQDVVVALDAKSGDELWSQDMQPATEPNPAFGGGVAVDGERVYVATGYGQVAALEAASGKEIWRQSVTAPIHAAPTVVAGRVFVITIENQLVAFASADGKRLWAHNGIPEPAGLLGGASPAVDGNTLVTAYSSGEIFALRAENGRALWTDNLAAPRPVGALAALADIRGRAVIDHGRVFAISHSGRMEAIDERTGDRIWEQDIGGTHGPWLAGDYLYVLGNDNDLYCLTREDGRVRWAAELPRYENEEKKTGPIRWSGPVLVSDRLVVVASSGEALSISPYTGKS
ncbi:MAG TPA: PQQ-binding-like beta-propeller repeat protein, partial [Stellaceae bacterium]|nr:PQQ-binding-like beta-propeller repeat protein [Stellaceae bacterium]